MSADHASAITDDVELRLYRMGSRLADARPVRNIASAGTTGTTRRAGGPEVLSYTVSAPAIATA